MSRIGGESRRRQPASARRCVLLPLLFAAWRDFGVRLGLRDQHHQNDEAENRRADISAAPAEQALHVEQRHRRDGRADDAGERMERKHLAEPFRRRVVRQQRIVGRVKDGVAEAGDAVHRDEDPVRIDDAGDRIGDAAHRQARDQHDARADAVDQESDRRLQHAGDDVEDGQRQRKLGVADVEVGAHEGEQRRQQQHIIMAHHMRGADGGDQPRLGRADRPDGNGLRHCGRGAFAACSACQMRNGVSGMSRWRMPRSASASMTAFITEVSAPAQPASPQPLTPSGLVLAGTG